MTGLEIGGVSLGATLLAVIAYFLKGRDKRLQTIETKTETHAEKMVLVGGQLDTISKRLSAGADSFREITNTQKQLHANQTLFMTEFVKNRTFEKEQEKTEKLFARVDESIDGLKDTVTEVKLSVKGIENTMHGGIRTMTDLLAKVVTIPNDPKERNG
jgi:hypothetical protein